MKEIKYKDFSDYFINEFGEVFSTKKGSLKKLKPFLDSKKRYLMIKLTDNKKNRKTFLVHRLVAEHFIENPDNLSEVNHKDYNPQNNHVTNLEWITRTENIRHANKKFSPIKNFVKCKLYYENEFVCECNSIKEAANIAKNVYNESYFSLIKYKKTKKSFIIT